MKLLNAIKDIISSMPNRDNTHRGFGQEQKISLCLPRGSGKTTTIKALANEYSSLVLVPSHLYNRTVYGGAAFVSIQEIEHTFRGKRSFGLKYKYILIDEDTEVDLDTLVFLLNISNLLEKDYFIIQLGTALV